MTFADLAYRFGALLYNNKQTILGSVTAALAFVQANPNLRNLVSTSTYEWTMMVVGLLIVLFARASAGGAVVGKVLPPSVPAERKEP